MLELKESFLETAGTVTNASICYDVWWELQNAENEEMYSEIVRKYFAFFDANSGAQLVTLIVLLYQIYETRKDTQNFNTLMGRIEEEESNATELVEEIRRSIDGVASIWKKVARARSTAIAHLSQKGTSRDLMEAANLTPNEIRDLIQTSKTLIRRIAEHFQILGGAAFSMSATGHTRQLMAALGANNAVKEN